MIKFEQEYLCQFIFNPIYEGLVSAWTEYHKAADKIDGHIKYPRNKYEYKLVSEAAKSGIYARDNHMAKIGMKKPYVDDKQGMKTWNSAKLEALRRMGK